MRTAVLTLILMLALTPTARVARADLKQYIDEQTLFAAEADLAKLDPAAAEQWLRTLLSNSGLSGNDAAFQQRDLDMGLGEAKRWLEEFKKAGGRRIYVVSHFGLMQTGGLALIMPAEAGGDAKKLASLAHHGKADGVLGDPQPATTPGGVRRTGRGSSAGEVINGNVAVAGRTMAVTYVRTLKPASREDFNAALAALGDAPLKVVVAPPPAIRAMAMASAPKEFFKQPSSALLRDVQWIAATSTLPPSPKIQITAKSTSPESAKALNEIVTHWLAAMSGVPPTISVDAAKLLTPTLAGDRLTLSADDAKLTALGNEFAIPLLEARKQAMMAQSLSNIRQILMAGHMYMAENKGKWPEDLKGLQKYLPMLPQMKNPRNPDAKDPYVYIKPANTKGNTSEKMVVYEAHKEFGRGVGVGFLDGHAEFVSEKKRFDELLAQTAVDQPAP